MESEEDATPFKGVVTILLWLLIINGFIRNLVDEKHFFLERIFFETGSHHVVQADLK
jgi:hypothetical protein